MWGQREFFFTDYNSVIMEIPDRAITMRKHLYSARRYLRVLYREPLHPTNSSGESPDYPSNKISRNAKKGAANIHQWQENRHQDTYRNKTNKIRILPITV